MTLDERIRHWVGEGYRVTSQTPASAQLVRPKRFNAAEFVAMPLYLVEYLGQREQAVYLSVKPDGSIDETGSALEVSRYRRAQQASGGRRLATVIVPLVILVVVVLIIQAVGQ
jgi:hypothetical protein